MRMEICNRDRIHLRSFHAVMTANGRIRDVSKKIQSDCNGIMVSDSTQRFSLHHSPFCIRHAAQVHNCIELGTPPVITHQNSTFPHTTLDLMLNANV